MKTNNLMRFFGSVALLSLCLCTGGAWAMPLEDPPGGTEPEPDTLPTVYQSFFDGNPVYYQAMRGYDYKWYGGIEILAHSAFGDTSIAGVSYRKMMAIGKNHYDTLQYWARESEIHDKVWVRMPWDAEGREMLVVDMGLKKGDLFPISTYPDTIYYEVDSVYYLEHAGGKLKHVRLKPNSDDAWTKALETVAVWKCDQDWQSRHLEFIEGVGSNLGFVYRRLGLSRETADSIWLPLVWDSYKAYENDFLYIYDYVVCVERNGDAFYVHPDSACVSCQDEFIWLEEFCYDEFPPVPGTQPANESVLSLSRYLQVTPNPASAHVTLRWAEETDQRVERTACRIVLYNMQGVKLRTMTAATWPYTFSVADLPSGAYLLRVTPTEAARPEETWQATVRLMVQ